MFRRRRRRSYRPRRSYIRRRRYYPSPLRTMMNDSETRTMSFNRTMDLILEVAAGRRNTAFNIPFGAILSGVVGSDDVEPRSGRVYYAGMMFDRFRVKSCSVQVRPKIMPASTGVPNYTFYLSWDRYYNELTEPVSGTSTDTSIYASDPSSKMIIWAPGGNASTISHYVYSLPKDRYQYFPILHNAPSDLWTPVSSDNSFYPTLCYLLDLDTSHSSARTVKLMFQFRFTLEFMGSASVGYSLPTSKPEEASGKFLFAQTSPPVDTSTFGKPHPVTPT